MAETMMVYPAQAPPHSSTTALGALSCTNCGSELPEDIQKVALQAQRQIEDLQAQVRLLSQKATAAVDRWADYEDELQRLRSQLEVRPITPALSEPARTSSPPLSQAQPLQGRLSALLSRRSQPNLRQSLSPNPLPPTPSERELAAALSRETALREQAELRLSRAEVKLDEGSRELEELSQQLFEQANEMVATERRARAKLEERVKILEQRDVEKRKRLDRVEAALTRIERVRNLLQS